MPRWMLNFGDALERRATLTPSRLMTAALLELAMLPLMQPRAHLCCWAKRLKHRFAEELRLGPRIRSMQVLLQGVLLLAKLAVVTQCQPHVATEVLATSSMWPHCHVKGRSVSSKCAWCGYRAKIGQHICCLVSPLQKQGRRVHPRDM